MDSYGRLNVSGPRVLENVGFSGLNMLMDLLLIYVMPVFGLTYVQGSWGTII